LSIASFDARRAVVMLLAFGITLRLALAATTDGNSFDLGSLRAASDLLTSGDPFALYSNVAVEGSIFDLVRWPYPPGYFPIVLLADALASVTGVPFERVVRVPPILADLAIAYVLFAVLSPMRGQRFALAAAAIVLVGPSFVANSSAHGQLDSVAVLAPLIAVVLWDRDIDRRWLWCGLLIGVGAAIKTPMGLLVLALLPTTVSLREAVRVLGVAVAVPVLLLVPFLVSSGGDTVEALSYGGLPGVGGLSLLVQPGLATAWLGSGSFELNPVSDALHTIAPALTLAALGATTYVLWRRRVSAIPAAAIVVLVLWVMGVNFALGYAIWGLPFLLLAGRLRLAVLIQVILTLPILVVYARPETGWDNVIVWTLFVPCMVAFFAVSAYALVRSLRATSP
jgi:hypothetical protein